MDTINGHRILLEKPTPAHGMNRAGRILLIALEGDVPEYATGWAGVGDNHWTNGHYFADLGRACMDFRQRAGRGY
jgi:hypothetical protein